MKTNNLKAILTNTGECLYGDRWQTELARDLGYRDGRQVRQWVNGDRKIPDNLLPKLQMLLVKRADKISTLLYSIKTKSSQLNNI